MREARAKTPARVHSSSHVPFPQGRLAPGTLELLREQVVAGVIVAVGLNLLMAALRIHPWSGPWALVSALAVSACLGVGALAAGMRAGGGARLLSELPLEEHALGSSEVAGGTVVVADLGVLGGWSGARAPTLDPTAEMDATSRTEMTLARDFRIVGPQAQEAAALLGLASCPYLYDQYAGVAAERALRAQGMIDEALLNASIVAESRRVSHEERARRAARGEKGAAATAGFLMNGAWALGVGAKERVSARVRLARLGGIERWMWVDLDLDTETEPATAVVERDWDALLRGPGVPEPGAGARAAGRGVVAERLASAWEGGVGGAARSQAGVLEESAGVAGSPEVGAAREWRGIPWKTSARARVRTEVLEWLDVLDAPSGDILIADLETLGQLEMRKSVDRKHDVVCWGPGAVEMAHELAGEALASGEHGWVNLDEQESEAKLEQIAQWQAGNNTAVVVERRAHTHRYFLLEQGRTLGGRSAQLMMGSRTSTALLTPWQKVRFPVLSRRSAEGELLGVRILIDPHLIEAAPKPRYPLLERTRAVSTRALRAGAFVGSLCALALGLLPGGASATLAGSVIGALGCVGVAGAVAAMRLPRGSWTVRAALAAGSGFLGVWWSASALLP